MSTIFFIDNDAILKLVACDSFLEAIDTLGGTPKDLHVLQSAKFMFKKQKKLVQKYTQTVCDKAILIVEQCQEIESKLSLELESLNCIEGIDPGEANLIAATNNKGSFYLVTGDKRCLKALALAPNLNAVQQRLNKRVVCFEQLIWNLIEHHDFNYILNKLLPNIHCDGALSAVFGSGERSTKDNVLQALSGYICNLHKETKELLLCDIGIL